jgi:hypothetical protein
MFVRKHKKGHEQEEAFFPSFIILLKLEPEQKSRVFVDNHQLEAPTAAWRLNWLAYPH